MRQTRSSSCCICPSPARDDFVARYGAKVVAYFPTILRVIFALAHPFAEAPACFAAK